MISRKVLLRPILTALLTGAGYAVTFASAKDGVLAITDTPETTEYRYSAHIGSYIHALDYFLCPQKIFSPDFKVKQVGWLDAAEALKDLGPYDALVLWDAPVGFKDKRGTDPWYCDLEIIPEAAAKKIVKFVENGGALVVAGGTTCYGTPHKMIGASDDYIDNKLTRECIGFANSPLAAILPVSIPSGVTLVPLTDPKTKTRKAATVKKEDPMISGLDFNHWGFDAYHKVTAKEGSEVLIATEDGDPLVTRWRVKKGGVVCVMAAPRGNMLVRGTSDPFWPEEAVLWDRAVRWSRGKTSFKSGREKELVNQYRKLVAPPPSLPPEVVAQEYLFGLHDPSIASGHEDLVMRYCVALGANTVTLQGTPLTPTALETFLKSFSPAAARNNLFAFLHPDIEANVKSIGKIDPKDYAQVVLPSGAYALWYGQPYPCPHSPNTVKYAVEGVESFMPTVVGHPWVRGAFFDDEWAWFMAYLHAYEGNPGIACYCERCKQKFKKATGQDAPPPVYREPGYVAPEDDLWMKWCEVIRMDAYRDYCTTVKAAFKKSRPNFILSNYPGGYDGSLDIVLEEVYLDCRAESELEAFDRLDVRANALGDTRRNRTPIWALVGMFRTPEDKSMYPETMRLTVGSCLAAGFKGIIFWHGVNIWAPYMQCPGHDTLEAETQRLGKHMRKFGAMYLNLKKPDYPVGVLSSWMWNSTFQQYQLIPPPGEIKDKEMPWWGFQIGEIAIPAALRAGLLSESITEKQLTAPELAKKKAIILPGLIHCRAAVVKNLEKFIADGGSVFVDESTKVKIKGATQLPVDFSKWHYDINGGKRPRCQPTEKEYCKERAIVEGYIAEAVPVLRKLVGAKAPSPVSVDSPDAVCALLENGTTKYLFVLNANIAKENTFPVELRGLPSLVYDLEQGKRLDIKDKLDVTLPAGGFKVFAFSDQKVGRVEVQKVEAQEKCVRLTIRVLDDNKQPFNGAIPLRISWKCGGQTLDLYRATNEGVLDMTFSLGGALQAPEALMVQELFTDRKCSWKK